jgi:hypothetical protein
MEVVTMLVDILVYKKRLDACRSERNTVLAGPAITMLLVWLRCRNE